ncbi:hypothetical protein BV20DRAFT_1038513 [Pilatotrama ljubarskyi]|nr:hypothetical protein BV20DRAFT_1038513 [Pilatotrama ljubarskyi]
MPTYLERLDRLDKLLSSLKAHGQHDAFLDLLKNAGSPELPQVVEKAGDLTDRALNWAYTDGDLDFVPSYAHSVETPPVKDSLSPVEAGINCILISHLQGRSRLLQILSLPSRGSRCEVAADTIPCPVDAAIAADGSALAIIQQGGQDKDAAEVHSYGGFHSLVLEPGLSQAASEVAVDTPRRLALVADSYRMKPFSWGGDVAFGGWTPARGKNVHIMKSAVYDGPLAALPGGRVARAGKGGAALWNLDELQTHKGGKRVGRGKFDTEHSWRENEFDEIELSTGSEPTSTHFHEPRGHMLCGESGHKSKKYGCYAVDLEHGGKTAAHFSAGDPNVFMTACGNGYARLFDERHPLPVTTLDSGKSSEFCLTVQLIYPDGIPTVFTGSDRYQCVKTWDVRARSLVYELGTGNTSVRALSWDTQHTTLYATTEGDYMDRLGYTHGYRPAHIPGWAKKVPEEEPEKTDEDEYDDYEDDWDGEHCWPERAPHEERYFGYAYDPGEHVLHPEPDVLPDYGQARMGDSFW